MGLIVLLMSCKGKIKEYNKTIFQDYTFAEINLNLELIHSFTIEDDMHISAFFATEEQDVILFDLSSRKILKFSYDGNKIYAIGGDGNGPNEYFPDSFVQLTYCGGKEFYSNDWYLPRFHIHDLQLEVKRLVNLNGIPYDITCIDENKLAVLYSNIPQIDILNIKGSIDKSIKLDLFLDHDATKESVFKHFVYTENKYFFAYYFQPLFLIYDTFNYSVSKILLTMDPPESITTATRRLLVKEKEIHLFYFNINEADIVKDKKITHVFDRTTGEYKSSYIVPERIKNYSFISPDKIIALEDSQKIGFYKFYLNEK